MALSLHAASIMHTNIATDIRVAKDAGYSGIELWIPKLTRYLEAGFTLDQLAETLGSLQVTMLDVLLSIERRDRKFRKDLMRECERSASIAARLSCPAIQVVALDDFSSCEPLEMRRALIDSLTELSDIAAPLGVRLALEPVSFSPFRKLSEALAVIDVVGPDRVGLVLDTWHLWTSGTPWHEVAALDPSLIVCVQISDTNPKSGTDWSDTDRTALPGDGIVPLCEGINAIRSTGFDGVWSVEMLSQHHWEWEPQILASELLHRAKALLTS